MVVQGFIKKEKIREQVKIDIDDDNSKREQFNNEIWCKPIQDDLRLETKFPLVDQSVSEALCVIVDIDNWQVGLLSNHSKSSCSLEPVGMLKLISNMLKAFLFLQKEFHSPE